MHFVKICTKQRCLLCRPGLLLQYENGSKPYYDFDKIWSNCAALDATESHKLRDGNSLRCSEM